MTKLLFYYGGKATFLLMFIHKNMRMIGFLEQKSIQKKQDVTFLLRNKNVKLKKMEVCLCGTNANLQRRTLKS